MSGRFSGWGIPRALHSPELFPEKNAELISITMKFVPRKMQRADEAGSCDQF